MHVSTKAWAEPRRTVQSFVRLASTVLLLAIVLTGTTTVASASLHPQRRFDFKTDFENVTKLDTNHLNMGITNGFQFDTPGGAAIWMEGRDRTTPNVNCHSGSRCVGMELTDITKSRRNEFNILHLESLLGDEIFVSVWLYLPPDWQLHSPTWNSYAIANPYFTDTTYAPYSELRIYENPPNDPNTPFNLDLVQRDISNNFSYLQDVPNYSLPRGRWFNLQYYVYRDVSNGIIKVWIDGALVLNVGGISTKNPSVTAWFTTPAKIYYETSDTFSPYRIWVDDLQIYGNLA